MENVSRAKYTKVPSSVGRDYVYIVIAVIIGDTTYVPQQAPGATTPKPNLGNRISSQYGKISGAPDLAPVKPGVPCNAAVSEVRNYLRRPPVLRFFLNDVFVPGGFTFKELPDSSVPFHAQAQLQERAGVRL